MPAIDSAAAPQGGRPRLIAAIVIVAAVAGAALLKAGSANAGTVPAGGIAAAAPRSATAESSPPGTPGTSPFPPSAPTNLVVTGVTTHSVTLTWTASTAGCCPITEYGISASQAFTDVGLPVGQVGADVTSFVYDGLLPTTQYSFIVWAVDSLGQFSISSNRVTLTTPVADDGDTIPPTAPGNLTIAGATLSWQPSTDNVGVTGYQVYEFNGLFRSYLLATVTGTSYVVPPSASASGSPVRPWVYYVRAIDAAGNASVATDTVPNSSTPPTSISPTPSSICAVTYTNVSQWPYGFVASVTVTNVGSTPVAGWNLGFSFGGDQRMTATSGATFSQSGHAATLRNTRHDAVIQPGASVTVWLSGTWHGSNAAPTGFRLNGAPCTTG
jgi:endoglucanase/cellulose 1,4-beta-cellobiosidase